MKTNTEQAQSGGEQFKVSNYLDWAEKIEPHPSVIYVRVSDRSHADGLPHQRSELIKGLTKLGFPIVATINAIEPGWKRNRKRLGEAFRKAKAHRAILVAESSSRFCRRRRYKGKLRELTARDMELLKAETNGVRLVTLKDPDMTLAEERAEQTKRGQKGRGRKGGRPKDTHAMKRTKLEQKVLAHLKRGLSLSRIAHKVRKSKTRVAGIVANAIHGTISL